jgi:hypothetical protein
MTEEIGLQRRETGAMLERMLHMMERQQELARGQFALGGSVETLQATVDALTRRLNDKEARPAAREGQAEQKHAAGPRAVKSNDAALRDMVFRAVATMVPGVTSPVICSPEGRVADVDSLALVVIHLPLLSALIDYFRTQAVQTRGGQVSSVSISVLRTILTEMFGCGDLMVNSQAIVTRVLASCPLMSNAVLNPKQPAALAKELFVVFRNQFIERRIHQGGTFPDGPSRDQVNHGFLRTLSIKEMPNPRQASKPRIVISTGERVVCLLPTSRAAWLRSAVGSICAYTGRDAFALINTGAVAEAISDCIVDRASMVGLRDGPSIEHMAAAINSLNANVSHVRYATKTEMKRLDVDAEVSSSFTRFYQSVWTVLHDALKVNSLQTTMDQLVKLLEKLDRQLADPRCPRSLACLTLKVPDDEEDENQEEDNLNAMVDALADYLQKGLTAKRRGGRMAKRPAESPYLPVIRSPIANRTRGAKKHKPMADDGEARDLSSDGSESESEPEEEEEEVKTMPRPTSGGKQPRIMTGKRPLKGPPQKCPRPYPVVEVVVPEKGPEVEEEQDEEMEEQDE